MATQTITTSTAAPDRANGYPTDAELEALSKIYPPDDSAYLPDEEPMPESFPHSSKLGAFVEQVRTALEDVNDVVIGADVNLYHQQGVRSAVLAPDLMIIFHEQAERVLSGNSYYLWAWHTPPAFIMEFGSENTASRDLGVKRDTYARIGVHEYWMHDPHTPPFYGFRLRGERLVNGAYEPIPMYVTEDGWRCAYSEALGYEICWTGTELRLRDPETGILVPTRRELQEQRRQLREQQRELQGQLRTERQRADAAEEELARLKDRFGI